MTRDRPEAADRTFSSQRCILGSASVPASRLRPAASDGDDQRALIHLPPFLCTPFASTVPLISHDQGICPHFGLLSLSNRPPQNVVNQTEQPPLSLQQLCSEVWTLRGCLLLALLAVTRIAAVRFSWAGCWAGWASPSSCLPRFSPREQPDVLVLHSIPEVTGLLRLGPELGPSFASLMTFHWLKPNTGLVMARGRGCSWCGWPRPRPWCPVCCVFPSVGLSQVSTTYLGHFLISAVGCCHPDFSHLGAQSS